MKYKIGLIFFIGLIYASTYKCSDDFDNAIDEDAPTYTYNAGYLPNANNSLTAKYCNDTTKNCTFELQNYAIDGNVTRKACSVVFTETNFHSTMVPIITHKNTSIFLYMEFIVPKSRLFYNIYLGILDMVTCEFKHSQPLRMNVTIKPETFYQFIVVEISTHSTVIFYNDDDTIDVFLSFLELCDGDLCRVRFNLDGEILEGPTTFIPKGQHDHLTQYKVDAVDHGNPNSSYLITMMKMSPSYFTYTASYLYVQNGKVVNQISRPPDGNKRFYKAQGAYGHVSVCSIGKVFEHYVCNIYDFKIPKRIAVMVSLSGSLVPINFIHVPDGGFIFVGGQCGDSNTCNKTMIDSYLMGRFDANGRPGNFVELVDFACPETGTVRDSGATFKDGYMCFSILCSMTSYAQMRRKCIPKKYILGDA